jgi:hypothetical protein
MEEEQAVLRVNDFVSIANKTEIIKLDLEKEVNQHKKSRKEVDQIVVNHIAELLMYITQEDLLGVARFNKISEDIRQQYPLPHEPVKSLI